MIKAWYKERYRIHVAPRPMKLSSLGHHHILSDSVPPLPLSFELGHAWALFV